MTKAETDDAMMLVDFEGNPEWMIGFCKQTLDVVEGVDYIVDTYAKPFYTGASWKCPELRAKQSAICVVAFNRPEVRKQRHLNSVERFRDPTSRAKHSEIMRASWARRKAAK
jgi:hypothetical protein